MRLLTASIVALQIAAFPRPDGYVNDFASILDEAAETYLERYLATLERETSTEVVVATVTSLDGMTIEEYANRLFADWGIGNRHKDNGILLLVAPGHREVRIEIGYGLEGTIPDGLAGDIIRGQIIPQFTNNNFPKGIGSGLDRIARVVRQDPSASIVSHSFDTGSGSPPLWFVIAFLGSFIVIGAFAAGLGVRTKTFGPLIFGFLFGGTPWVSSRWLHRLFRSRSSLRCASRRWRWVIGRADPRSGATSCEATGQTHGTRAAGKWDRHHRGRGRLTALTRRVRVPASAVARQEVVGRAVDGDATCSLTVSIDLPITVSLRLPT